MSKDLTKLKAIVRDHMDSFYGVMADMMSIRVVPRLHVDGLIYYKDEKFHMVILGDAVNKPFPEVICLVTHEMWHPLLGHLTNRWLVELFELDPFLVNVGEDAAINCQIDLSPGYAKTMITPKYLGLPDNKTTEYYVDKLRNNKKLQDKCKKDCLGPDGQPKILIKSLDELEKIIRGELDPKKYMGDVIVGDKLEDADVEEFIARVGKLAGTMPGDLVRALEAGKRIKISKLLRKIQYMIDPTGRMGIKKTWLRQNRRNPTFRGVIKSGKLKIALLMDVSGSITEMILNIFASGLISLREYAKIFVMPTDTEVHEPFWFKTRLPESLIGGGGTDFHSAFKMAEEMGFNQMAIFTDGYCTYPDSTTIKNVVWGVYDNPDFVPKFGKATYLK